MNKILPFGIGIVAIIITITASLSIIEINPEPEIIEEPEWISSGPFSINKNQYKIGEKVAYSIKGLGPQDVGRILFVSPEGIVAKFQDFDGSKKCCFNQYWEPDTSRFTGLYKVKQLIGTWTIVFNGTNYAPLQFEIINKYVKGAQAEIHDIPRPTEKPIGPPSNSTN